MAELRDRYESHGFDNEGNDKNMKTFEKATKQLLEFSKVFPKEYKKQQEKVSEDYKEVAEDIGISIGESIKSSLNNSLSRGAATAVQALVGGAGPLGYVLEKTLNLSGATENLISGFNKSSKLSERNFTSQTSESPNINTRKESRNTFESYPTIVKLRAYLDYRSKTNSNFGKYMSGMLGKAKETKKFEKVQGLFNTKLLAGMGNISKILGTMSKVLGKVALAADATVNAFLVASYLRGVQLRNRGDYTGESGMPGFKPETSGYSQQKQAETFSGLGGNAFKYGDKSQEHLNRGSSNAGVDIIMHKPGAIAGKPVLSLNAGIVRAYTQLKGGSEPYDYKSPKTTKWGYGHYVQVWSYAQYYDLSEYGLNSSDYDWIVVTYAHLSKITVSQDANVKRGSILGLAGNTGRSTGAHLHIDVKAVKGHTLSAWEKGRVIPADEFKFDVGTNTKMYAKEAMNFLYNAGAAGFRTDAGDMSSVPTTPAEGVFTPSIVPMHTLTGGASSTMLREKGAITGGASSIISTVGRNDALMGANNITYNNLVAKAKNQNATGYIGELPQIGSIRQPTIKTETEEPNFQLSFDIENSATKALKQADKSIDFIKV